MTAFNLPPGCTLADIDRLFEESDEDQCLDTEVEDYPEDLTVEQMTELAKKQAIWEYEAKKAKQLLDEPLPF